MLLSPISACAYALVDPVEPVPTFHGYEILGYDDYGNTVLSNDDYVEYFNSVLEARAEAIEAGIQTYGLFDALESVTRFIPLLSFIDWGLKAAEYMLANPTMSAGMDSTYSEKISSVGKKTITYTKANATELITLSMDITPKIKEGQFTVSRTGFGATSTFTVYSSEGSNITVSWEASSYRVSMSGSVPSLNGSSSTSKSCGISMSGYSVNSLPNSNTTSTTLLNNTDSAILGGGNSYASYAENTFMTNDRTYNANHYLIYNSNNYWQPCTILAPITTGDTINKNNYNDYSMYGYYIDVDGNLSLDPDILAAYIANELLPQLELQYKQAYDHFPEPDATYGDPDIDYTNPFGDDEDEDNLPDTTAPPGGVVGGGGMTPSELDGVLNGETFYILDMETGLPPVTLDTLPSVNLPAELSSGVVGVSNFAIDLLDSLGLLPVFVSLSVLAFVVFALKGG